MIMSIGATDISPNDSCGNTLPPVESGSYPIAARAGWMLYYNDAVKTISANEATSLTALVAYVAHVSNLHEFRIERMLADHFHVPNIKRLPADLFGDAVHYLLAMAPYGGRGL